MAFPGTGFLSPRFLSVGGSVLLLITSGFHLTGLPMVEKAATEVSSDFFAAALHPLWLMPSLHWSLIALVACGAAWWPSRFSRLFLFVAAALVIIDAIMMYVAIGPFPGEALLAASGLSFLGAGIRCRKTAAPTQ